MLSTKETPKKLRRREGQKITLVAVIGGCRYELSITHRTD